MSIVATAFTLLFTSIINVVVGALAKPLVDLMQSTGWLDADTYSVMNQYCEDITETAAAGKLHDALCRDKEISSLIDILSRKGKGNPCITGDAGVGKTALVEALAYRISTGNVPPDFKNKKIIKVNMVNLIAGKSYNNGSGAVGRIRALFDKAKDDKNIILFIDEFHQIVQCNAAELFKTYLDRGEIKVIAATTSAEYGYISKDPALERRFTRILLSEPNQYETLKIMRGIKSDLEKEEGGAVKLSEESLLAAVELTGRYMKNKSYPDKAIDCVRSALKTVNRKNMTSKTHTSQLFVTVEDIKNVISSESSVPINSLSELESRMLKTLEERIKCHVVGQDEAVESVCDAVRRGRAGINDPSRPRASFFFTGLSGVGKSTLAECVGDEVGNVIKIDMSNYCSPGSVAEFTGTKMSGYKGELVERIWKNPYSVVLFDGIEKADRSVINIISGILDTGEMVDSSGNKVDFRNSIIVMTSNVGEDIILSAPKGEDYSLTQRLVGQAVIDLFGSQLVNRIDGVLVFNKLNKSDFNKIARKFIDILENQLSRENIDFEIDDKVIEYLCDMEIDHRAGARQIRKIIQNKIQKPLSGLIISEKVTKGSKVMCYLGENGPDFEIK